MIPDCIVGVDPGLRHTGVAMLFRGGEIHFAQLDTCKQGDGTHYADCEPHHALFEISTFFVLLIGEHPDLKMALAIEGPIVNGKSGFMSRDVMGRCRGAVMCAHRWDVIEVVAPSAAKHALTGYGRASKAQMIAAAGTPTEHMADAYGCALAAMPRLWRGER